MALDEKQIKSVEEIIRQSLQNKFENHNPEPSTMPFHTRLLGEDKLALYSFIHSLNTNFGTTIFKPVAVSLSLASNRFRVAKCQVESGTQISERSQYEIQKIMDNLIAANTKPNKQKEIEIIREVCHSGEMRSVKPTKVDVYLESHNGEIFLIDMKTAKPNKGNFKEYKRTLLEWTAIILSKDPGANVNTLIAIPYNPYEPRRYCRWTIAKMLDRENELKVAEEFWDFLGGEGAYDDLLGCFEKVGIEMRNEIDKYFAKFK